MMLVQQTFKWITGYAMLVKIQLEMAVDESSIQ